MVKRDSATDDLEPLFDYHRVQPRDFISIEDEDSDASQAPSPKRKKVSNSDVKKVDEEVEVIKLVDCDEEDWLSSPPKVLPSGRAQNKLAEDSTLKELRKKKEELASLVSFAKSAKDLFEVDEEKVPEVKAVQVQQKNPSHERPKLVVSIQDKDGQKQFRIYADDKFERFFKTYADKVKLDVKSLVFSFDGDKIPPTTTPNSLGMEDNDIIEVDVKKR